MILLEVVLFCVFVVPLGYATIQACRVNARRERERRRFNRDQSIRELESFLDDERVF